MVEGNTSSGVNVFRGIPFAKPPVGDLRWLAPQPVENWEGVLKADTFGPRPMQLPIFGDMNFRSEEMSEDCLYLNIWAPATTGDERLPVLVYFYGGGFMAGSGCEPRYDGESMARRGIVAVTVNYRLGAFGFFAHPELSREAPYHASGNYGYLDQQAALQWVQENIEAFGGDPGWVTIAGESAGSISVSAHMVSPLSKDLFAGAIGESGALISPTLPPASLENAEQQGVEYAEQLGVSSLGKLRKIPAQEIMETSGHFPSVVDGYFLPQFPVEILTAGKQAEVSLLVGWNSQESPYSDILGEKEPTVENYENAVRRMKPEIAETLLKLYPATTPEAVKKAAMDMASDDFIGYSTWKWSDVHAQNGHPVFRYYYEKNRPPMRPEMGDAVPGLAGGVVSDSAQKSQVPPDLGAVHSAEIEYAMGNLPTNRVYDWQPEDYRVSEVMQTFFANFIKTGHPSGLGTPEWPAINSGQNPMVMHIDVETRTEPEEHRKRYLFLDTIYDSDSDS